MLQLIYLAGPMRGRAEFGFPTFDGAANRLRAAGHCVFNPAEWDRHRGFDERGLTGAENLNRLGFDLRAALRLDLAWICDHATAVALLPGWQASPEATTGRDLGVALGLEVGTVEHFAPGPTPTGPAPRLVTVPADTPAPQPV